MCRMKAVMNFWGLPQAIPHFHYLLYPKFSSHMVWVKLTSFLAPRMGSGMGQLAGCSYPYHHWFRNDHMI